MQLDVRGVIGTCEHGWPGDSCGQAHPYMAEPTRIWGKDNAMTSTNGNPTQNALLELARQFEHIAASTKADSPTYVGYQLAMEHAAERARQAAEDHADFGTEVTI